MKAVRMSVKKGAKTFPVLAACLVLLTGCWFETPVPGTDDFVLRSGELSITVTEFSDELELNRSAYPYGIKGDREAFNLMVMNLIDQLSEELLLRREAAQKGIVADESRIDDAERAVRADYPDKTFEAMLLDNAVSYAFWRKRLGIGLVIEALLDREINNAIEISAEEISQYYEVYRQNFQTGDSDRDRRVSEKDLVAQLRMKKAEEAYPAFIRRLGESYPVEVNRQKLAEFLK
jgi:hypothetical protein